MWPIGPAMPQVQPPGAKKPASSSASQTNAPTPSARRSRPSAFARTAGDASCATSATAPFDRLWSVHQSRAVPAAVGLLLAPLEPERRDQTGQRSEGGQVEAVLEALDRGRQRDL